MVESLHNSLDRTRSGYQSLELPQLFDAVEANLALIKQALATDPDTEILQRRLDKLSSTLQSVSSDFWSHSYSPDAAMYLLLLILQKLYDSLIHYVDSEHIIVSTELREGIPASDSLLLKLFPRGQVKVSLEILLSTLKVCDEEKERTEEYVHRAGVKIARASRHFDRQLEKVITVLEMWTDQLSALYMFTYAHSSSGSTTAVKLALSQITQLLSLRELRSRSGSPAADLHPKSQSFLWQDLHSGGDGSGRVYKIRIKDYLDWDGKSYACKVIRQNRHSTSPQLSLERNAIQMISKGRHPNVVEVFDTWVEETKYVITCFIQMELCQGDLAQFLQSRYHPSFPLAQPLSFSEVWEIFRQIMEGLEYIHSLGLIHRDLKPKNVLYTNDTNGDLVWKIADFGFAAPSLAEVAAELNPLKTGHMTQNYCAPEVIIGSRCEQSADIWSTGSILYELATGNPPFMTEDEIRAYAWSGKVVASVSGVRGSTIWRMVDAMVGRTMHVASEMRPTARKIIEGIPRDCGQPTSGRIVQCPVIYGSQSFVSV